MGQLLVAAACDAETLVCAEGLSFWGGVDPDTGVVIDAHHPLRGQSLAGRAVVMPTSRGSCSGSGVLLQLALNGKAPAALVFREDEDILTLGALIAARMFDRPLAVLRVSAQDYAGLAQAPRLSLSGVRVQAGDLASDLLPVTAQDLDLSASDRAMLTGVHGKAVQRAMEVLCIMAAAQGAERLMDVTRGHIDGCILAHDANLIFAETMADLGAQVAIPTTINAISVDRENWAGQGVPSLFGSKASRLADAYTRMGARPTFTCAPYYAADPPQQGEDIGWSESNAVIFANTVLGARTAKHPDYLDLFIAMTGRAPCAGVYLTENRRPQIVLEVDLPPGADDALWPLLGWLAGKAAPDRIPLLCGLEAAAPGVDDLRAICAAFGTTSAAPMLHVAGVTPEADLPPPPDAPRLRLGAEAFAAAWDAFNSGPEEIDLIALGSPHLSLDEIRAFAGHLAGGAVHPGLHVVLTAGREVLAQARAEAVLADLERLGVRVMPDLCWCSITEPLFPPEARSLMTNSGKYAHYAPGLSGRAVRFGSLAACASAARSGRAAKLRPDWLEAARAAG